MKQQRQQGLHTRQLNTADKSIIRTKRAEATSEELLTPKETRAKVEEKLKAFHDKVDSLGESTTNLDPTDLDGKMTKEKMGLVLKKVHDVVDHQTKVSSEVKKLGKDVNKLLY